MTRTAEDNAQEFGALSKQGKDFRLALLVACSVERRMGQGARQPLGDRKEVGKVSAAEFARVASTQASRVLRHLDAWDRLAAHRDKLVPLASSMQPGDADGYEPVEGAVEAFDLAFSAVTADKPSGGRPRASATEVAQAINDRPEFAQEVLEKITPAAAAAVADAPVVRAAAAKLPRPASEHRAEVERARSAFRSANALQHLIDAETVEPAITRMVGHLQQGLMDKMPRDVRDEAVQQFKRWINALEWAITLAEGGSITDEALADWLAQ